MLHFFGEQRYFKKVSQKNNKYFLFLYFFGSPKQVLEKSVLIELINVLYFNEKKN